jgi:hypothetical protein
MHDDQHGTAIISSAALLNALELADKKIGDVIIVISGAGAAAMSCAKLYISLGADVKKIFMFDSKGLLHAGRKDLEDKTLLFPSFDNLTLGLAIEKEGQNILEADLNPLYDNVSECILEIEELKNELTTIVMTQTSNGPNARDRWDTPETKLGHGKKGRLRKDRYSSLIIANMLARQLTKVLKPVDYDVIGANAKDHSKNNGSMYRGPEWFINGANDDVYTGIYR